MLLLCVYVKTHLPFLLILFQGYATNFKSTVVVVVPVNISTTISHMKIPVYSLESWTKREKRPKRQRGPFYAPQERGNKQRERKKSFSGSFTERGEEGEDIVEGGPRCVGNVEKKNISSQGGGLAGWLAGKVPQRVRERRADRGCSRRSLPVIGTVRERGAGGLKQKARVRWR